MELDYNDLFEIKKRSHGRALVVLATLSVVALVAYTMYILITKVNIGGKDIEVESTTYYAVTMAEHSDEAELQAAYNNAIAIGGSGYVWKGSEISYLIALIYPREDMARSVVASNNIENFTLEISAFDTPNVAYNLPEWDKDDVETVSLATNMLFDMGNVLYELTIACQIKSLSTIACASTINNYKGDMKAYIASIDHMLQVRQSSDVERLYERLITASNLLEKLVNDLLINDNLGNILKYSYCEYIYMLCNY